MNNRAAEAIQLGINARMFPINWRPAVQEIGFAAAGGFRSIQLHGGEQGLDETHLGAPFAAVAAALEEARMAPVMEIVVRVRADGRTAAGSTPLDVLRANLTAIRQLGIGRAHWHLAPAEAMRPEELRTVEAGALPQLLAAVELADSAGFRFGLEHNEPDIPLFATPDSCAAALEAAPGLGFVWDLNHTPLEQLGAFLAFAPRMSLLHVSDTPLPEVNHHLPLGMGAVDFRAYLDAAVAGGYSGPAILEIGGIPKSGGFGRDTDEALLDSRARLLALLSG
jgi:L-ribulose-5-phosphate 3-epimerase